MEKIAIVQKKGVRASCPRRFYLVGKGSKAKPALRLIAAIVPTQRMRMQVSRRKKAKRGMNLGQLTNPENRYKTKSRQIVCQLQITTVICLPFKSSAAA